jgi:transcriptional regulatory protein RtcR
MLHARPHLRLAHQLQEDIATASPETKVNLHLCDPKDPWDFPEDFPDWPEWVSPNPPAIAS